MPEMRLQCPEQRWRSRRQAFEFRDHACDGAPLAIAHAFDHARHIGVRNARDRGQCFLVGFHHTR
jgi:hypothetical protein